MDRLKVGAGGRCGMTMVELLLTLAIATFFILMLYTIFTVGQRSWYTGSGSISLQNEIQRALMAISNDLPNSGNESAVIRAQVDQRLLLPTNCPSLVYQVPLSNLGAAGWGALDLSNGSVQNTAVWIHRSDKPDGTNDGAAACTGTGRYLVRQLLQPGSWLPSSYAAPNWLFTAGLSTNIPTAGIVSAGTTRVLTGNLNTTATNAFTVQAYRRDPASNPVEQATNWPPAAGTADFASQIEFIQLRLMLRQATTPIAGAVTVERVVRVHLRNRYRP